MLDTRCHTCLNLLDAFAISSMMRASLIRCHCCLYPSILRQPCAQSDHMLGIASTVFIRLPHLMRNMIPRNSMTAVHYSYLDGSLPAKVACRVLLRPDCEVPSS